MFLEHRKIFSVTIDVSHEEKEIFLPSVELVDADPAEIGGAILGLTNGMRSGPSIHDYAHKHVFMSKSDAVQTTSSGVDGLEKLRGLGAKFFGDVWVA